MISSGDGVLAISYSGASEELTSLLPHIKNFNIPIIGMSKAKDTILGSFSDAHIDISVSKEACPLGIAPTSSTTLTLALGDALAVALMNIRGFGQEDFAKFHPAGALGKRLYLRAEHFLIDKSDLPVVAPSVSIKEAIIPMSEGRLGNIIVAKDSKVVGIFSDGDLRRALLREDFDFNAPIEQFMSKEPFAITDASILAVDALKIIESKRIQLLLVVKEQSLVGAIHIHDLIEAGIESENK
jgi:arabinose-5-phosphate isomerase